MASIYMLWQSKMIIPRNVGITYAAVNIQTFKYLLTLAQNKKVFISYQLKLFEVKYFTYRQGGY